jgi:hypothetical protein
VRDRVVDVSLAFLTDVERLRRERRTDVDARVDTKGKGVAVAVAVAGKVRRR